MEQIVILNTCPDEQVAQTLATQLVERELAACVNIVRGITSIYRWQGQRECEQETLLLIKTTTACYASVEAFITEQHPYEVPEIIALPVSAGLPAYLNWLTAQTKCHDREAAV